MHIMKRGLKAALFGLAVVLICTPAHAGSGNVNFAIGQRSLDQNDYQPVDQQPFLGVTADFQTKYPFNFAGGLYYSHKQDSLDAVTDVSASITEATFGVLKSFDTHSNMHPFVGGGLGFVQVHAQIDGPISVSASDSAGAL